MRRWSAQNMQGLGERPSSGIKWLSAAGWVCSKGSQSVCALPCHLRCAAAKHGSACHVQRHKAEAFNQGQQTDAASHVNNKPLPAGHLVQQRKVEALDQVSVRHIAAQVLGVFIGHIAQVALLAMKQDGRSWGRGAGGLLQAGCAGGQQGALARQQRQRPKNSC